MTLRVALLGKPLRRRHSQVMHDAAFDACGIDARYVLRELEPHEVPAAVSEARGPGWLGLGVTAPYKLTVAELVDEVEPDAALIGAVNNVVRAADGRLIGFNSDAPGFRAGVERALGRPLAGARVVVAGAGGAAHAVVFALLAGGAAHVTIGARVPERAAMLADRFANVGSDSASGAIAAPGRGGIELRAVGLGSAAFRAAVTLADLAVNATTVGMVDAGVTIDVDDLPAHATVFDLVYVPFETPLLAAARARALNAANGSEMLIAQAAIAFERWTGIGDMADVMRDAVTPLLRDPSARA